jgi:hypothetical protein
MSRPSGLSLMWVLIGAFAILVLNDVMRLLLAGNVGASLGVYALIGIVAFGSFFVGGLLIGLFSPGETIREPALAAGIAVLINARTSFSNIDGQTFTFGHWLGGTGISVVLGFAMGLAGAWIGEKLQGDTGDKMRERGDLPPATRRPDGLSLMWVLIGALAILVLNDVMRLLLAGNVGASLGVYALIGTVAFGSFFVGGLLIGLFSPGETIQEPALAAGLAVLINARTSFSNIDGQTFTFGHWLGGTGISVVLGFAMGLAGAWVGEKLQGDTGDKMRERGDLPPKGM